MQSLKTKVRDHILDQLKAQVRAAGAEEGFPRPPCSVFYLIHYAPPPASTTKRGSSKGRIAVEGPRPKPRRPRLPTKEVLELWRVTPTETEELSAEAASSVDPGTISGSFYENAIVSLWVDFDEKTAYVDSVLGPLHGQRNKYRIQMDGDVVSLELAEELLDY